MSTLTLPTDVLRQIAAAPHRLFFFIGATNVLLAMAWWAYWLGAAYTGATTPTLPVAPGWLHAIVMQYQVLPAFIFGFLLTVFPRWMAQPALARKHYVPVGAGLFGGQLVTLAALVGVGDSMVMLRIGAALTIAGWIVGLTWLVRLVYRDKGRTGHALSCAFALAFGLLGLLLYLGYLYTLDARVMFVAIKLGGLMLLLPIYFTVCHRMIPFFAGAALGGYEPVRPTWMLAALWGAIFVHTWLELRHAYAWLWLADVPLATLTGWLLWRWWPRGSEMPPLLRVLFLGFAWLPIAFALYVVQSLTFVATSEFVLGRGPAHVLFIGFFGSLLVAMVTRVTQGHSGRPLVLGRVAAFAFIVVQLVTVTRVAAELVANAAALQLVAAIGWLVAFLPWVLRSAWIYLTPRADGAAG